MAKARQQGFRAAAYILFFLGVVLTLAGMIPAMFQGNASRALAAAIAAAFSFLLSMWAGRYGFLSGEELQAKREEGVSWEPDHIRFDEENRTRLQSGPRSKGRHRPDHSEEGRQGPA